MPNCYTCTAGATSQEKMLQHSTFNKSFAANHHMPNCYSLCGNDAYLLPECTDCLILVQQFLFPLYEPQLLLCQLGPALPSVLCNTTVKTRCKSDISAAWFCVTLWTVTQLKPPLIICSGCCWCTYAVSSQLLLSNMYWGTYSLAHSANWKVRWCFVDGEPL